MSDPAAQLPQLSDAGRQRQEAILRDALAHARRRRTRRHVTRALAFGTLVLIGAGLYVFRPAAPMSPTQAKPEPNLIARNAQPDEPAFSRFAFSEIKTDGSILDRYTVAGKPSESTAVLNDDELLNSLQQVGVDAGIAHVGSQALVGLNDRFFTPGAR